MARDQEESKFEDTSFKCFSSATQKYKFWGQTLNLNVIMSLLCISTEIKSQEDKSTAGHDIILE